MYITPPKPESMNDYGELREKPISLNGFSLSLSFGSYAGFGIKFRSHTWRICLGCVSLVVWFVDLENFIAYLRNKNKRHI